MNIGLILVIIIFLKNSLQLLGQLRGTIGWLQAFHKINWVYIFCIIRYIAFIIAGFGVLTLKKWGRYLMIISAVITSSYNIWQIINCLSSAPQVRYETFCPTFDIIGLIFNVIIILYFTYPKVKEQFK